MIANSISADLTEEDQVEIMGAIATIHDKLSFLTGLSQAERKSLCRLGDKTRSFVNKAIEMAAQNGDLMPRYFDLEEMRRDLDLVDALYPIMMSMAKLQELIEDTYIKAGSEAYEAARVVYRSARAEGTNVGINSSIEELGQRFTRKKRKPSSDSPTVE